MNRRNCLTDESQIVAKMYRGMAFRSRNTIPAYKAQQFEMPPPITAFFSIKICK
jgi:hypothetical protein